MYDHYKTLYSGRWLQSADHIGNASVVVIGKALSTKEHLGLGDTITLKTATGPHDFNIVGIDSGQNNNGIIVYVPLSTLQHVLQLDNIVSGFHIRTINHHHDAIDKLATKLEDEMISHGYVASVSIIYIIEELSIQSHQQLVNIMFAVGTLIVLITMVGLMSNLTMNVLERTQEIGMFRCLGARTGQIKSVFRTEGLVIAVMGWAAGVLLGYIIGWALNWFIGQSMQLYLIFAYPADMVLLSLVLTVLMTWGIIWFPIRRATRFKPGEALRYQ